MIRSSPRKRGPRGTACGPWIPACAGMSGGEVYHQLSPSHRNDQFARWSHRQGILCEQDCRRPVLLDERRALDCTSGAKRLPPVDRAGQGLVSEIDGALVRWLCRRTFSNSWKTWSRPLADQREADIDHLHRLFRCMMGIGALYSASN